MKEDISPPIAKKIDTVKKTEKPQASKRKKDESIRNKADKGKSLNKLNPTQITET